MSDDLTDSLFLRAGGGGRGGLLQDRLAEEPVGSRLKQGLRSAPAKRRRKSLWSGFAGFIFYRSSSRAGRSEGQCHFFIQNAEKLLK